MPSAGICAERMARAEGKADSSIKGSGMIIDFIAAVLMTPVLGAERTEEVIRRVNALEKLNEVRELRPFLAG
jgi:hypothetical protein